MCVPGVGGCDRPEQRSDGRTHHFHREPREPICRRPPGEVRTTPHPDTVRCPALPCPRPFSFCGTIQLHDRIHLYQISSYYIIPWSISFHCIRIAFHRLTHCNVGAFGGRSPQFSGLLDYSQLLMADGEILFSGSIHGLYFFSSVFFLLLFFLPIAFAHSTTAQTKPRQSQYLRTTRTVEQPVIGPAQSNKTHTYRYRVRSCRPDSRVQQRKN